MNWLYDPLTGVAGCVDWEFAGASESVFDVADLVEHISARQIDDAVWANLLPDLGVVGAPVVRRFEAAQRTCAIRWLAVLWKQRSSRPEEFARQLSRVEQLLAR